MIILTYIVRALMMIGLVFLIPLLYAMVKEVSTDWKNINDER
jgi:hypothetical protein